MKNQQLAHPIADWAKLYASFGAETPDECWELFKLVCEKSNPDECAKLGYQVTWAELDMEIADVLIFMSGSCT